jgi:hypothetical protein
MMLAATSVTPAKCLQDPLLALRGAPRRPPGGMGAARPLPRLHPIFEVRQRSLDRGALIAGHDSNG